MITEGSPFSVAILLRIAGIGGELPLSSCKIINVISNLQYYFYKKYKKMFRRVYQLSAYNVVQCIYIFKLDNVASIISKIFTESITAKF